MSVHRVKEGSELDGDIVFETHRHTPLQVTRWSEQRVGVTFTASNQIMEILPVGAILVELTATENCFINFGGGSVVATAAIAVDESRLFLAGVQVVPVPLDGSGDPFTHVAVIQQSVSGVLQVEECK